MLKKHFTNAISIVIDKEKGRCLRHARTQLGGR